MYCAGSYCKYYNYLMLAQNAWVLKVSLSGSFLTYQPSVFFSRLKEVELELYR